MLNLCADVAAVGLVLISSFISIGALAKEEKILNISNGPDYLAPEHVLISKKKQSLKLSTIVYVERSMLG